MLGLVMLAGFVVFGFGFYQAGGVPSLAIFLGFLLFSFLVNAVDQELSKLDDGAEGEE